MQDKLLPQRTLILNVNEFGGAVLKNNWKLISISTLPSQTELYDIEYDPSEESNVADRHPDIVKELSAALLEASWEMVPSLYLEDLSNPRSYKTPIFWGENPQRP
jgi:ribosome biogenesis protein Tsr3